MLIPVKLSIMALYDAVVGAVADLTAITINVVLRVLGYSEMEAKRIEGVMFWMLFALFVTFLVWLTIRFS